MIYIRSFRISSSTSSSRDKEFYNLQLFKAHSFKLNMYKANNINAEDTFDSNSDVNNPSVELKDTNI